MTQDLRSCCSVCGCADARALVDIRLVSGVCVTLCGSHAVMHKRSAPEARSEADLRALLRDRRGRRDRRQDTDELGAQLNAAFSGDQRAGDRRGCFTRNVTAAGGRRTRLASSRCGGA